MRWLKRLRPDRKPRTTFMSGDCSGSVFINCDTDADQFFDRPQTDVRVEYWLRANEELTQRLADQQPEGCRFYLEGHRDIHDIHMKRGQGITVGVTKAQITEAIGESR